MLRHGRQNVNGQLVGVRHVAGHKFNARVHQPGDEMHVARQPVELGDHELGLVLLAGRKRGGELRAVVATLAAFDLDVLSGELPGAAVEVVAHGLALCVESQSALSLLGSRYPVVGRVDRSNQKRPQGGLVGSQDP